MNRTVAASLGVLIVVLGGLLLTAALADDKSYSHSSLRVSPSSLVSLSTVSFAGPTPSNLSIVSPSNGSFKDRSTNSFITLYQLIDLSPITGLELKVDNGSFETIPLTEIEVEYPPVDSHSPLPQRLIRILDRFENKLKPGIDAAPGKHTLVARIKTLNAPAGMESAPISFTIMAPATGANFSPETSVALFEGAADDCGTKKKRECVRKITVYLLAGTGASGAELKTKAEKAFADIKPTMMKACVSFLIEYKMLSLGKEKKGFNPENGTITDIEDLFHSLHKTGSVTKEDGTGKKDFSKEMGSWSAKGPTPIIMADKVYQDYDSNPQASQHGLTFKSCKAVVGKSECNSALTAYTLIAPASEPGVLAHEIGHDALQKANFNIEEGGVEQHHTMDYKASQNEPTVALPEDNFMNTPVPSGPLGVTEKQAGAIYKACKEYGGTFAMTETKTSNYCVFIDDGLELTPLTMVCTDGEQNEESCFGNTVPGHPKLDKGKYDPQHDYCPLDNDCPGDQLFHGPKCDISRCVCVPWWWPVPGDPGYGEGGNPDGSTGTPQGGNGDTGKSGGEIL